MARKIIVLEKLDSAPGLNHYRYALWADVPTARQGFYAFTPLAGATVTPVKDATDLEKAALTGGQVTERIEEQQWQSGVPIATIQAELQVRFAAFQAEINGRNPWIRYGTYWDGSAWTIAGVA